MLAPISQVKYSTKLKETAQHLKCLTKDICLLISQMQLENATMAQLDRTQKFLMQGSKHAESRYHRCCPLSQSHPLSVLFAVLVIKDALWLSPVRKWLLPCTYCLEVLCGGSPLAEDGDGSAGDAWCLSVGRPTMP